ncbi:MCE family protein [Actinacidiphila oryziradicis]|uniref:MCE family protein n=1 Tax=Actinacidiphila oryziradicis TaxID=2571141 RepID=A0A4U0RWV6_9ACTN|nr:MlaD family protein [Actinacidiphila oryziradicis]TKA00047.1 MCE family protein [Actinacidiphila oryziradicis]
MNARASTAPLIKFSVFAVVTILATALLAATIVNIDFTPTVTYSAVFSDVTGLETGDDVRVAGVRVGQVQDIRIKDRTLAEVTFDVTRDRPLLTSTGAVIHYRNLVGQRYIALTEGAGDGSRLAPNSTIPLSRTQPALDLNALLDGFKPLFAALSPNDVNQLASELISTLQGEGGTVDSLLAHTASLTSTLANRDQLIGSVIDNLNTTLATVDKRSVHFSALLDQLQQLVSGLSADRTAIGDSLTSISNLAGATSGLLAQGRPALRSDIAGLSTLAGTLQRNNPTVEGVLQRLPHKLNALTGTATYGSWFNYYLCGFDGRIVLPKGQVLTPRMNIGQGRCGS